MYIDIRLEMAHSPFDGTSNCNHICRKRKGDLRKIRIERKADKGK